MGTYNITGLAMQSIDVNVRDIGYGMYACYEKLSVSYI
jgi:hypothetical protein